MKKHTIKRYPSNGTPLSVKPLLSVCSALALAGGLAGMQSQAQTIIPPTSKVTPDTTKAGFTWRVFANPANQVNTAARADAALSGALKDAEGNPLPNLADPNAVGAATGPSSAPNPENAAIDFTIETVINLSQTEGTEIGNFPPDAGMPGVPATDGSSDGVSADIITYLELPVGTITMGVNSDDGFRTTAGDLSDAFRSVKLGAYEGGRGSSDSLFTFQVTEAGVYPFKTTYYEGGGDANIEWFTVKEGVKVLVNDTANGGLKAYRAAVVPPKDPYIQAVSPLPGLRQLNKVTSSVVVILADGDVAPIEDSTIDFKIDGIAVTDKKREGKTVTLTYAPTGIQFPGEAHTATLTFKTAGGFSRTETWGFKNLKNVILPTPLVTENFDSAPEGGQPAGWVATNFTADCEVGEDFTDQRSSIYMNWAVTKVENMGSLDSAGLDQVNATEKVNGQPLTIDMLRSGSVLYAESDSRCNGDDRATVIDGSAPGPYGQTQFVVTKAFDLSAIKDPVFSFSSGYMQNQDSYGGVEYSVDGGVTFLPIVYFLDEPDILVAADGTTDGVATLTTKQPGETSVWVVNGVVKGEAWGDAAAAPINAEIGNYIVPRINDDGAEGKRVEIFRLPAAANKSDVRLRFSATGSDSWYFWVDNLAFYDIPSTVVPTVTVVSSTTLGGAYTTDASAVSTGPTSFSVPISGAAKYFRLDGAAAIKTVSIDGANLVLTY